MIKIKIFKNRDVLHGFECSGHAEYDDYGKDILCATVSGITQSTVLGIKNVCKIKASVIKKSGYLKMELPKELSTHKIELSNILILTMMESIKDLMKGYSDYISMEVIDDVY